MRKSTDTTWPHRTPSSLAAPAAVYAGGPSRPSVGPAVDARRRPPVRQSRLTIWGGGMRRLLGAAMVMVISIAGCARDEGASDSSEDRVGRTTASHQSNAGTTSRTPLCAHRASA